MILVDTSLWIEHLRVEDDYFRHLLDRGRIVIHPYVLGEIILGSLRERHRVISRLQLLPQPKVAAVQSVEVLIEQHKIAGSGIGYVDAHLVASTLLTDGATLWTRDRRLGAVAERLGVAHRPLH